MKILIQFGNKGDSVTDHLITPIAYATNVEKILMVCRHRGPEIPKVEYYSTPHFVARFAPIAVIYEFLTLLRLAIFGKPDCIGGYLLFPHVTMAFLTAKLTGKPVIASLISGPYEFYTQESFEKFDFSNPPPWHGRLFLKLLKHSDVITTTGKFTKNFLTKHGVKSDRIYPMINPANETKFHPVELPKVHDVVSVATLIRIKHIEIVLYAISRVKMKYPNIKACIVGDGSSKRNLMKIAVNLGIKDNVTFVGFQKDVTYYYNSARIFVHTSEHEGFPNVFLEASMCGLPCVVSDCGDITDIAQDGYNCIVIPEYKDYEAFAEAIIHLLDDGDLYREMAKNALKSVQKLSRTEITETWEKIFNKIRLHS